MKRHGFTLIELLVVIAIIAILAAILFPVFAKAREKARQTSCANNEKQMGTAIMQYTQDYDEKYPGRYEGWNEWMSWKELIQPYIKNRQVYQCPSNTRNYVTSLDGHDPVSYACNGWDEFPVPMPANGAVAIAAANAPASLILLCESCQTWNEMNLRYCYSWRQDNHGGLFLGHNGMANFVFADGHVKAMKATATYSYNGPVNMWSLDGPNVNPFEGTSVNEVLACQQGWGN